MLPAGCMLSTWLIFHRFDKITRMRLARRTVLPPPIAKKMAAAAG
jgi:hypothetical protein